MHRIVAFLEHNLNNRSRFQLFFDCDRDTAQSTMRDYFAINLFVS